MIGPRYTSFIRVRIYAPLMGGIENPEKKRREVVETVSTTVSCCACCHCHLKWTNLMIGPPYTSFIRVRIYAPLMGGIENPEKMT